MGKWFKGEASRHPLENLDINQMIAMTNAVRVPNSKPVTTSIMQYIRLSLKRGKRDREAHFRLSEEEPND